MSHSLWGHIQDSTQIAPGVRWVSTAGHGGLMVAKATGERLLSEQARAAAEFSCGCYCFEEDCLYAVAFYERPEWQRALEQDWLDTLLGYRVRPSYYTEEEFQRSIARLTRKVARTDDEYRAEALLTVASWNIKYLHARGFDAVKTCNHCGDVCRPYCGNLPLETSGYSRKCTHPEGHTEATVILTPRTTAQAGA